MLSIKKNLCILDRVIRGVIALVTIYFGVFQGDLIGDPLVQGIVLVFGALNAISALFSWCMVYQVVGISSLKRPA